MPYLVIEDFKAGLDKRRLPQAAAAGSLTTLKNAHINRGGEIEKAKAFVQKYTIPAGTFGLAALGDDLYVFGSEDDPGMPTDITYQQLVHEDDDTIAMSEFLGADVFAGVLFALAAFENGDRRAFLDAAVVTDLLSGSMTFADGLVPGDPVLVYKNKVYLTSGTNLLFSGSGAAGSFDTAVDGAGLIDVSTQVTKEVDLDALCAYQNSLAVFSSRNISIWAVDPDPAAYANIQTLPNIGTKSPRSVVSFGDHDVFFLAGTGIRSLRAVNSSLAAGVTDVGTPIDDLVVATMDSVSDDVIRTAVSVIEPKDGRYICSLGDLLFVFTYFASSKISAWSTYEPGINMTDFAIINNRMYARGGNDIYLYGGDNNDTYTPDQVVVELPYLDGRGIATWKAWTGIDLILEGTWDVYVNTNPNQPDYWIKTATITRHTIDEMKKCLQQAGTICKFKFVHQGDGPAKLSKIIVHYESTGRG